MIKMEEITIIGAGASGLMAMTTILEKNSNRKITIIERNEKIAKKILLTGGGRCNLTNAEENIKKLLENYPRSKKFLKFALHEFSPEKTMEWFESKGIKLKIEDRKRVFPDSNKASTISDFFAEIIKTHNINLLLNTNVLEIKKFSDHFEIFTEKNSLPIKTKKLLITTGGIPHKIKGKLSFGYETAKKLGHKIIELKPGLTAFLSDETKDFAGISIKNTKIMLPHTQTYEFKGDILFTHKGLSGPGIFAISSLSAYDDISKEKPATIKIDLRPDKNIEELREEIKTKSKNSKSLFTNILSEYINKKIAKSIYQSEKKANEVSKKEINKIIEKIKNFEIIINGRVSGEEIVTIGGIDTKDINEKTMESKICPNLFFAGEILNIDGFTGGFNLQSAWSTGKIAGKHI